jgi:hypothetical protein
VDDALCLADEWRAAFVGAAHGASHAEDTLALPPSRSTGAERPVAQGLTKEGDAMAGHAINQQSFSGVPWRVWEPTPAVQFPAQPEASASKKPAVWAWNPVMLPNIMTR